MTSAWTAARNPTRQHLLWGALALSLVLNLCFVGGALWIRIQGPMPPMSPEERFHRMEAELVLDPEQRQAFARYSEAVGVQMQHMRDAVDPLMNAVRSELAKPNADEATVTRLFEEAAQVRRGYRRELIGKTLAFLAVLSPEQRAKFVEHFHQRLKPWGQRPQHP